MAGVSADSEEDTVAWAVFTAGARWEADTGGLAGSGVDTEVPWVVWGRTEVWVGSVDMGAHLDMEAITEAATEALVAVTEAARTAVAEVSTTTIN